MPSRRNDRVAPPGPPGRWEARFAATDAATGWEGLVFVATSNTWEAFVVLTTRPTEYEKVGDGHGRYPSVGVLRAEGLDAPRGELVTVRRLG